MLGNVRNGQWKMVLHQGTPESNGKKRTLALSLAKHFAKANNKRSSRWITDLKYDESDMGEARKPSGIKRNYSGTSRQRRNPPRYARNSGVTDSADERGISDRMCLQLPLGRAWHMGLKLSQGLGCPLKLKHLLRNSHLVALKGYLSSTSGETIRMMQMRCSPVMQRIGPPEESR